MSKRWLGLLLLGVWIGGGGVAHAAFNESPGVLDFGNLVVNQSARKDATLSATGQTDVTVTVALEAGGDCSQFQIVAPTGPVTVNSSTSQTVTVAFAPTSPGDKTCTVDVNNQSGGGQLATFQAIGHAAAPQIAVNPPTIAFGHVDVNRTGTAQMVTATNSGDAPLTISSATLTSGSSDFVVVSGPTTTTTLPNIGDTAVWTIACKPSAQGARSGTFEIASDSLTNATFDVPLTCTGDQGVLTVNPTSIPFGLVQRGTSQPATFTLTNTGNVAVSGITGALTPTTTGYVFDPATVPATLAPNGTATLTATFAPTSNSDGGSASIAFNGTWSSSRTTSATLALTGTAASVSVATTPPTTPLALDFGTFRFDQGPSRTYRITNDGAVAIMLLSADFTPDTGTASTEFTSTFTAQTLTPGNHVDVTVTARPANRTGLLSGHIDVVTNITGAMPRLTLTGTATAAVVTATAMADFGAVDIDATPSPTQTVTLKNTGDATLNFSIAPASGASPAFSFTNLPGGASTLAPGDKLDITVTYKPTIERAAGDFDTAVLVAGLTGVIGGPSQSMISLKGRGIDRHLAVDAAPTFPATFRNPGDKAPIRPVTVHNTGEALLRITAEMITSDPPGMQLVDTSPVDIPGGGAHDFMVKFAPTAVGTTTGVLTLTNNDNARPMAMVTLTGIAPPRMVGFGPATIDLGYTAVGIPINARDILAVTNMNMDQPFTIHAIRLDGDPEFQIDDAPSDAALPAGGKQTFSITFSPTSIRQFNATATLLIDQDPEGEGMMIPVAITGQAVFAQAHGSGGCDAGGGGLGGSGLGGSGLIVGLAALALRRRRASLAVTAAVMTLVLAPAARADGIGIAVFEPTPATTGTGFALQAPDVGSSGSWVMNAVASYASNPLVLDSFTGAGGHAVTNALVERSTLMQLGVAYALLDRLELGAHIPLYQQSGEAGPTGQPAKGTATGNLALHVKARLLRFNAGPGALVLGASAVGVIPMATRDQFTGSDQPEGRLLLLGSFTPAALESRLTISVNAGPVIRGTSTYANIVEKSGAAWGAGASVRILDELWATAELFGEMTPSGVRSQEMTSSTLSQVEGLAGLTIKPDRRVSIGLALGRGLTDAVGTPDLRGVVSVSIVPGAAALAPIHPVLPDGDADGDGIPDSVDKCPHEPEDKDGFQDADGCPDPDNDHDGIPDAQDKCPLDPEDKDGFQDADGCPDPDNDGDGIPDKLDKCPNEPEDKDGFEDLDGCPDPDNDHDGIPDEKDKCPNEPETINGFQDDDGCPDRGDSTIILSPDKIETLDPIQFTGVKLARGATPLIEQVGATLRAHPEILRVRVTVHVQPTNDPDADQARTDKRAQAVRDWLVQWGVAPARLEARGFGGEKPLVPPGQRGAAKLNDRIEFIILERK